MKKPIIFLIFAAATVVLAGISCQSAPAAPPPAAQPSPQPQVQAPPPAAGPSQALVNELNGAMARAAESRTRAEDFESPSYFPGEWEAAENQYAQAGQLPRATDSDIRRAIEAYNAAAGAYDSVFDLAIPLYAQAREDEIMALRDYLIEEEVKEAIPDYFDTADAASLLALNQYEAKDYYAAKDSAAKALQMYYILTVGYEAWIVKWEIDEREFQLYDADNYDRAGEIISDAADQYRAGAAARAQESAEEALLRYNLVLSTAWAGYAELRSQLANSERQAALDMKTNISAREYFTIADADNTRAQDLFITEQYEEASRIFVNAEAMFVIASMAALEKRQMASAALKQANEKIEESERTALQAEMLIEGGAR